MDNNIFGESNMFQFGKRKVQQNAHKYTHWITLPPEWLKNVKCGKGSELSIEMDEDRSLRIKPVEKGRDKK
jgi:glutaredoxin-related protein